MSNKDKPIVFLIPEDSNDMFVDAVFLQRWRDSDPFNEHFYQGLMLGFGENVFVFDKDSVEFIDNKEVDVCMFWKEPLDPENHKGGCRIGGGSCSQKWLGDFITCAYYKDFIADFDVNPKEFEPAKEKK